MSKLTKLNVPEKFFQTFLTDEKFLSQHPQQRNSSVMQKLLATTPTNRGKGQTRVIENLTEQEWEDLYALVVSGRKSILRDGRKNLSDKPWEEVLSAGVCAKNLAERMEASGVANVVPYGRKRKTADTAVEAPTFVEDTEDMEDTEEDTSLDSEIPTEPLSLPEADDVEEVSDDVQNTFYADTQL